MATIRHNSYTSKRTEARIYHNMFLIHKSSSEVNVEHIHVIKELKNIINPLILGKKFILEGHGIK